MTGGGPTSVLMGLSYDNQQPFGAGLVDDKINGMPTNGKPKWPICTRCPGRKVIAAAPIVPEPRSAAVWRDVRPRPRTWLLATTDLGGSDA